MENSENNELIKNFPIGKKYQIIYADPPWQYGFSGTRIEKAKADQASAKAAEAEAKAKEAEAEAKKQEYESKST